MLKTNEICRFGEYRTARLQACDARWRGARHFGQPTGRESRLRTFIDELAIRAKQRGYHPTVFQGPAIRVTKAAVLGGEGA